MSFSDSSSGYTSMSHTSTEGADSSLLSGHSLQQSEISLQTNLSLLQSISEHNLTSADVQLLSQNSLEEPVNSTNSIWASLTPAQINSFSSAENISRNNFLHNLNNETDETSAKTPMVLVSDLRKQLESENSLENNELRFFQKELQTFLDFVSNLPISSKQVLAIRKIAELT